MRGQRTGYVAAAGGVRGRDPFAVERAAHAAFAARRVHPRREFFRATADEASTLIALIANVGAGQVPRTNAVHVAPPASAAGRAPVVVAPEEKLRAWVEAHYTRVPLREKDTGTKLERIYTAYTTCVPPVHASVLGRNTFAHMLESTYVGIGPHRGSDGCKGIYLLR